MSIFKNKVGLNLIFGLIGLGINLLISFLLSPYIVQQLGVEANGFISLANNFVSYMTLFVIALNSMSNRAITLRILDEDYGSANSYYSSVGLSNVIISVTLLLISIPVLLNLEFLISIPSELVKDVKLLFIFIFLTFILNTVFSIWNVSTFVSNRVYLQSIRNVQSQILKAIIICFLFYFFKGYVSFVGIATFLSASYAIAYSYHYKKKLTPYLKIKVKDFDIKKVIELVSSGIWNTVSQTGLLLLSGIDLLIANVLLGPTVMGLLAISKILPSILAQLAGTVSSVFVPQLTIMYAKQTNEELVNGIKKYIDLTSVILNIPIAVLILHSQQFYSLWMPSENSYLLSLLSILSIISIIIASGTEMLPNIFLILNRLKINSLVIVLSGVLSAIICFFMVKTTNYGIYAIAATSSVINLITKLFYTIPFSAKYLGVNWRTFYPKLFKSLLSLIITLGLRFLLMKNFNMSDGWISFILEVGITVFLSGIINIVIYRDLIRNTTNVRK